MDTTRVSASWPWAASYSRRQRGLRWWGGVEEGVGRTTSAGLRSGAPWLGRANNPGRARGRCAGAPAVGVAAAGEAGEHASVPHGLLGGLRLGPPRWRLKGRGVRAPLRKRSGAECTRISPSEGTPAAGRVALNEASVRGSEGLRKEGEPARPRRRARASTGPGSASRRGAPRCTPGSPPGEAGATRSAGTVSSSAEQAQSARPRRITMHSRSENTHPPQMIEVLVGSRVEALALRHWWISSSPLGSSSSALRFIACGP